jgi:hypothetical protein
VQDTVGITQTHAPAKTKTATATVTAMAAQNKTKTSTNVALASWKETVSDGAAPDKEQHRRLFLFD